VVLEDGFTLCFLTFFCAPPAGAIKNAREITMKRHIFISFMVSAQKFGVGAASAAREPCALRLEAHLQDLIPGLHALV